MASYDFIAVWLECVIKLGLQIRFNHIRCMWIVSVYEFAHA